MKHFVLKEDEPGLLPPTRLIKAVADFATIVYMRALYTLSGLALLVFAGLSAWAGWHYHEKAFYAGTVVFLLGLAMLFAALEPHILKLMRWAGTKATSE